MARNRVRHQDARTFVRKPPSVGRREMTSPRMTSGRLLMRSARDSVGSSGPGALLAGQPGPRSTSGSDAGRSLICVHTNLKEKNGRNIHVGHSKSILKIWKKKRTNIYVGHSKSILKIWPRIISTQANPSRIISKILLYRTNN